jgi:hypothetical protein
VELVWPIRQSFVDYVEQLDGVIATSPDVARTNEGFVFQGDAREGGLRFAGSVSFTAHEGMLDLTISDPELILSTPSAGTLSITVRGAREILATLAMVKNRSISRHARPVLTVSGARLFHGGYQPGDPLDDLEVRGALH